VTQCCIFRSSRIVLREQDSGSFDAVLRVGEISRRSGWKGGNLFCHIPCGYCRPKQIITKTVTTTLVDVVCLGWWQHMIDWPGPYSFSKNGRTCKSWAFRSRCGWCCKISGCHSISIVAFLLGTTSLQRCVDLYEFGITDTSSICQKSYVVWYWRAYCNAVHLPVVRCSKKCKKRFCTKIIKSPFLIKTG